MKCALLCIKMWITLWTKNVKYILLWNISDLYLFYYFFKLFFVHFCEEVNLMQLLLCNIWSEKNCSVFCFSFVSLCTLFYIFQLIQFFIFEAHSKTSWLIEYIWHKLITKDFKWNIILQVQTLKLFFFTGQHFSFTLYLIRYNSQYWLYFFF